MCTRRILGLAVVALLTLGGPARAYTNQWAAHIEGGEEVAKQVAKDYDFRYLGKVSVARIQYSGINGILDFFVFFFSPYTIFAIVLLRLARTVAEKNLLLLTFKRARSYLCLKVSRNTNKKKLAN